MTTLALLTERLGPELEPNAPRYAGAPGHVESYFLRAVDPARPRALWLKATILAPLAGEPVAESWLIWFDGERGRTYARRETQPLAQALFVGSEDRARARAARLSLDLGSPGSAQGGVGEGQVDLAWELAPGTAPASLSALPGLLLHNRSGFPRSRLNTPLPSLRFRGRVEVPGERVELAGWVGSQGHNWGREHAFEYAWGQVVFPGSPGEAEVVAEGFSARVQLRGHTSPRLSALVVRRGEEELRWDAVLDAWRQEARLDADRWELRLRGGDGEARLTLDASGRPMACLGYRNPDGRLSYCTNSKLARAVLQVQPRRGGAFERRADHLGALEFLRHLPDPRFPEVV